MEKQQVPFIPTIDLQRTLEYRKADYVSHSCPWDLWWYKRMRTQNLPSYRPLPQKLHRLEADVRKRPTIGMRHTRHDDSSPQPSSDALLQLYLASLALTNPTEEQPRLMSIPRVRSQIWQNLPMFDPKRFRTATN